MRSNPTPPESSLAIGLRRTLDFKARLRQCFDSLLPDCFDSVPCTEEHFVSLDTPELFFPHFGRFERPGSIADSTGNLKLY